MARQPSQQECRSLFELLGIALKPIKLDRGPGKPATEGKPDEFMLMQIGDKGEAQFKHCDSRNYVYLFQGGTLVIPKTESPFNRGTFEQFPY